MTGVQIEFAILGGIIAVFVGRALMLLPEWRRKRTLKKDQEA